MDERSELKQLQDMAKSLARPFEAVLKVKVTDAALLAKLESALSRIPSGKTVAKATEELEGRGKTAVARLKKLRVEQFGRILSDFIRAQEKKAVETRELEDAWRVGKFELQFRPETSDAKLNYNREPLEPSSGWEAVAKREDLDRLLERGEKKLSQFEIPGETLSEACWNTYCSVRNDRVSKKRPRPETVPLYDFHREFRVTLTRLQLEKGKPDKKLSYVDEFPLWAFLYNLDRYHAMGSKIPKDRRLMFETGSQAERNKGMYYVMGGLKPGQPYKSFCHLIA